ncbi:MAG: response regulator [Chitinispirillaceae bacterium]|nr:response regulator [Chitinispirillaceae bacterium]
MVQGPQPHILLIDDELSICVGIQGLLETDGYNAAYSLTYQEGLDYLDQHPDVDIVLLDVNLRSELSGIEVLPLIKERNKYIQVIMFTSYDRLDVGLECIKRGAMDFMTKPFDEKNFLRVAPIALEKKRLEQIKDLYFDMVVHDLKNPLQCICGSFEMLREQLKETLTPIQKRLFETAESGIHQIQLIIGNILGITSFEKGSLIARRESFAVAETIYETTKLYDLVEVNLPDTLPVTIRSDRDLYIRILTNIISNALRFATIGSKIQVSGDYDTGSRFLTTSVMNRGSFIDAKHREAIFNKFIGVQRSIGSLRGQNFGLGLTFSKMAAEALEGAIWVESNKETQETTFKFKIKDFTVV